MDNQLFRDIPTDLDLNGPILSFTTQPTSLKVAGVAPGQTGGPTATFTAVAIVSFPGDPTPINSGTIGYQWYGPNGILTEGTKYVGTKTTTLQITNVTSPTDVGFYYVQLDYVPSTQTGNAVNEPLNSNSVELTSFPVIEINAQPTPIETIQSRDSNFNIDATLSDNGTDIGFQWQLDGENVSDGTVTKSTVEEIPGTTEKRVIISASFGNSQTIGIPVGARNVLFNVCGAAGGKGGGNFDGGSGSNKVGGRGGFGMEGWFHIGDNFYHSGNPSLGLGNAIQVTLNSGQRGNDGVVGSRANASGGNATNANQRGGSGGAHGWGANNGQQSSGDAGGGGGGGASSVVLINGSASIIAGGGGGGGGSFNNANGNGGGNGQDAGPVRTNPGPHNFSPSTMSWVTNNNNPDPGNAGSPGHSGQGIDTPGGGGGGAGAPGGGGGHHGHRPDGSPGGIQGMSSYMTNHVTYRSGSYNTTGNGWASVSYTVDENAIVPTPVTRTTTVSGSATNQLTLNTDGPGIGYTVRCNVNSSVASNSPVTSDEVGYRVESTVDTADIVVEGIGLNNTSANISTTDLANGELTLDTIGTGFAGPVPTIQLYSLYAPDKDVDIEMDLYGGGVSNNVGGEGGFARIRFTMTQNMEYVIAGLTDNINTPFLYRQGTLMACVGEGGKSGLVGARGGNGGGINMSGGDASGFNHRDGGKGGQYNGGPGGLTLTGAFGSAYTAPFLYPGDQQRSNNTGGFTLSCPKGVYWASQPIASLGPCAQISGSTKFRLSEGTEVTNTADITRGYKAGYNVIQTAGRGISAFRGGNGAKGGDGGNGQDSAGGGGSGYGDGSFTVVRTTQGGSTSSAKVVIRVAT